MCLHRSFKISCRSSLQFKKVGYGFSCFFEGLGPLRVSVFTQNNTSITFDRLKTSALVGAFIHFTYPTLESLCGFLKLVHFVLEVFSSLGQKHEDVGLDFSTEDFRGGLQEN